MRWLLLLPLILIGCGDDGAAPSDGGPEDGSASDAAPDASTGCDYTEQQDTTNDTTGTGTAEDTQLVVSGATTVCGSFSDAHFDGDITADVDAFHVQLSAPADLLVRLEANASSVELVGVDIYTGATFNTLVGTATWYGDHAVTAVHLPAGTYELLPYALNSAALASAISYRVKLSPDDPATRCPPIVAGGVAEANDGANSTGNDVYSVPSGAPLGRRTDALNA